MAAAQDTVKFTFEVPGLASKDGQALSKDLKNLTAVADAAVNGSKITISLTPDKKIKLTDIKDAVAKLKNEKGEALAIQLDSLKLEGRVVLTFTIDKKDDKIIAALKGVANVLDVKKVDTGFEASIKSPAGAKTMDLSKAVAKGCDLSEEKAAEILKDITWFGAKKPESKGPAKPDKKGG